MGRSFSKRLVVDASVARAAGETVHPVSSACRETLEEIRKVCHRLVLSPDLRREWSAHASKFSRKWLANMENARKVVYVDVTDAAHSLLANLEKSGLSEGQQSAARKDAHLVAAAQSADGIVVSLDHEAWRAFRALTATHRALAKLMWVDPAEATDEVLAWLRGGATRSARRRLGAGQD